MSPRIKPRTPEYAEHLDKRRRNREAAHEYAERHDELLDDVQGEHRLGGVWASARGPHRQPPR